MIICHITSAHNRGDARIFKHECVSLAKAGNEVFLICCDGGQNENNKGVIIKSYSSKKFSKKERVLLLIKKRRFIKYLLDINADIYQFHDIELIEIGRKLSKTKKVIFDSHEDWKAYLGELISHNKLVQKIFGFFYERYYHKNLKKFSAILTVSPNFLRNLKVYTDKVFMVPNYPILKSSKLLNQVKTKPLNDFVYEGTVYGFSNQINIVKALFRLSKERNVKYKIVGKISSQLKNEIFKTPGYNNVEFTNWVSKDELDDILLSTKAGLCIFDYVPICANKEGNLGSNKIFEYMQAGLPVICTDFILWKELIIDKYKCGICVNPSNVEEIYNAMNFILSNPEEAKLMGQRGRQAIIDEFNWENSEKEFINIYNNIYHS